MVELFQKVARRAGDMLGLPVVSYANGREIMITFGQEAARLASPGAARHASRSGYRLVVATEGTQVAGFSWGYIGERGQHWADLVDEALPDSVADEWVGGHFEFVELGVTPTYRRHGLGRRLHDALLDGISQKALLSTTDDLADAAVQLYLSSGWRKLGAPRPGTQVMGRDASDRRSSAC